jgi:flagellar biosynthesis/type III secretory pathway protein FliH
MIIKKKKKIITEDNELNEQPQVNVEKKQLFDEMSFVAPVQEEKPANSMDSFFKAMPMIQERSERRRGDRRRGYRRVDDRNLISRAHEESNAIREQSAREGFEYGLAEAREELKKLGIAIKDLVEAKERAMEKYAGEIALIAIKVAEKIIKTEVACDETIVMNLVTNVLKSLGKEHNSITIKANPEDVDIINMNLPKLSSYFKSSSKIHVSEDEEIEQGSCVVETTSGMIDATFVTQLKILEQAFETGI